MQAARSRSVCEGGMTRTNAEHVVRRSVSAIAKRCGEMKSGILNCRELGQRGSAKIIWGMWAWLAWKRPKPRQHRAVRSDAFFCTPHQTGLPYA